MKVNLTDEDLATRGDTKYFSEGIHEVAIVKAERGKHNGKEYVEFKLEGENGETDTARLWFTTDKSAKYALSIMAGVAVHNKDSEAEKEGVRSAFKKITDTDQVDNKFLAKFEGMVAFFQVAKSDTRTYTDASGETKPSYDKNIYGYRPKEKVDHIAEAKAEMLKPIDPNEIPFE